MKRFCENSSWECINQQAITFLYSGKGGIRRMRPFARMLVTSRVRIHSKFLHLRKIKPPLWDGLFFFNGGERGIRTLGPR